MFIWCGMLIFPVIREERDGYGRPFIRHFVVNGCLMRHIGDPRRDPLPDNDNGDFAA